MPVSVAVMTLVTAVVAVLASRQVFGGADGDFENPWVLWGLIGLLALFCVVQIFCLFSYGFRPSKIGFYLFHIGVVAVLAGSLVYCLNGIKIAGVFPVNANGSSTDAQVQMLKSNRLRGEDYTANFNSFYIGVTDFTVEYYEAVYDIYRLPADDSADPVCIRSDVTRNSEGRYDFGEYGEKNESELMTDGAYDVIYLTDDVVAAPRQSVKYYGGDVTVVNLAEGRSVTRERIEVNKPLRVNGWKIYLMGYDEESNAASFVFKYDPAEYIELAGYWMMIAGAFLMVLIRPKEKDGDAV